MLAAGSRRAVHSICAGKVSVVSHCGVSEVARGGVQIVHIASNSQVDARRGVASWSRGLWFHGSKGPHSIFCAYPLKGTEKLYLILGYPILHLHFISKSTSITFLISSFWHLNISIPHELLVQWTLYSLPPFFLVLLIYELLAIFVLITSENSILASIIMMSTL